eukprot:scaffold72627_cov54-Attheya_sp.AAC.5
MSEGLAIVMYIFSTCVNRSNVRVPSQDALMFDRVSRYVRHSSPEFNLLHVYFAPFYSFSTFKS